MLALSVRQPYAEHILTGHKTLEVRSWQTHHRGPLLIVSSQTAIHCTPDQMGLLRGYALGVVDLVDMERVSPHLPDRRIQRKESVVFLRERDIPDLWLWRVANPRRVSPFPVRGKLKLFNVWTYPPKI